MTIVTRFAPSPTGYLHIGGARTALFNWLYTKHVGGRFLLRIEDTDQERSSKGAVEAIYDGLKWLGLDWEGDAVLQSQRAPRHREVAEQLLASGNAYHCYCTPDELTAMRELAMKEGRPPRYDGRWRDRDPKEAPPGVKPAVRLKAPRTGETVIDDQVQGEVRIAADQLDDMVLLRSDGTPTYMMAVVVDDHDMGITHVIRGVDHLTNAARQIQLFRAMNWHVPVYAHIPLIHGPDGAKLSKRHGALGVQEYAKMGYLPEAMRNYLARLGWSHGDAEIFSTAQAIEWFDLPGIGRSAARFDFDKLRNLNGVYLQQADDDRLANLIAPNFNPPLTPDQAVRLKTLMPELKKRAKDLNELADNARFLTAVRPLPLDSKAEALLGAEARAMLGRLLPILTTVGDWTVSGIEAAVRAFGEAEGRKLGDVAQPIRAALTGKATSPGVFDVMAVLGRDVALGRITDVAR